MCANRRRAPPLSLATVPSAAVIYACWMVPAWRRFHGTSFRRALLSGVILSLSAFPAMIAYRYLLFWLSHWSAS